MSETKSEPPPPTRNNPLAFWRWKLHWQILLGLIVGALIGYLSGAIAITASEAIAIEAVAFSEPRGVSPRC